jgi:hypothetical protein
VAFTAIGDAHSSDIAAFYVNGPTLAIAIDYSGNLSLPIAGIKDSTGSLGSNGQVLSSTSTATKWVSASSGTVTSVALSAPSAVLTVGGSPITTSGTLAITFATQTANYVWAGPTSGIAAIPTFRALVAADIPSLPYGTGTVTRFSAGTLSPLFTTSVATATTTPALSFSLSNAGGGTVFGNATGSAAAPGFTASPVLGVNAATAGTLGLATSVALGATITLQNLGALTAYDWNYPLTVGAAGSVLTSQAGGSSAMTWTTQAALAVSWSSLVAATGNLTLNNVAYTTTFQQQTATTVAGTIWQWANTTTATGSTQLNSPQIQLAANYYTGSASAADTWTIGTAVTAGTNGASQLNITHAGSTGATAVSIPGGTLGNQATGLVLSSGYSISAISSLMSFNGPSSGCNFLFYQNGVERFSVACASGQNSLTTPTSGDWLQIYGQVVASVAGNGFSIRLSNYVNFTGATANGLQGIALVSGTFAPTSENTSFQGLSITPTINDTSPGLAISSAVISSATSAAVTIPTTQGYVIGANVTISGVTTTGFTGLNGTWVVASATSTVLTMTTSGLTAKAQATCNGTVGFGVWAPTMARYQALNIAVTETALANATGNNRLIDCYAGSAATTPIFGVDNQGAMYLAAAAAAPTSAGTAGTAGEILYYSGFLYLCTVTGVAGSATWTKISSTAV